MVIAYQDSQAIGCGAFKKLDNETIEIKRMYVKFAHRGSGTAQAILPLKEDNKLNPMEKEKLMGIVKFSDGTVEQGDLVGFKSYGQYEFVVDGKRLYRVKSNFITLKYEYQGNEKEYNPSWANSS